jgi:hypothetical protein
MPIVIASIGLGLQVLGAGASAISNSQKADQDQAQIKKQKEENERKYNEAVAALTVKNERASGQEKTAEGIVSAAGARSGVTGTNTASSVAGLQKGLSEYTADSNAQKDSWLHDLQYENNRLEDAWNNIGKNKPFYAGAAALNIASAGLDFAGKGVEKGWFDQKPSGTAAPAVGYNFSSQMFGPSFGNGGLS